MEVVNTSATINPAEMYNTLNGFIMQPLVLVLLVGIIVLYCVFFSGLGDGGAGASDMMSFGASDAAATSMSGTSIAWILGIMIVILILFHSLQYVLGMSVVAYIRDWFSTSPAIDVIASSTTPLEPAPVPELRFKKQVFNIPGNNYNYENAKAICTAYGADLATYDQVERAYNRGAEWCNYGWSADQMALFPTQKQTYDKLPSEHKHDCGRPGVNGGYIANPAVKFGVNCYGYKPKMTGAEEQQMLVSTPYPESAKDMAFNKRVDYWRKKLADVTVSPFNYNHW